MAKITVNKKEYNFEFDYLAIRRFGKEIGINRPSEIQEVFKGMDLKDPSFDDIDIIVHLVRSAISDDDRPSFNDTLKSIIDDPEGIAKIFDEFNSSVDVDITEEEVDKGGN